VKSFDRKRWWTNLKWRWVLGLALSVVTLGFLGVPSASAQVFVHPSATAPGANVMIPGSGQFWRDPVTGAVGYRYLGVDGRWHGATQFADPWTGNVQTHIYRNQQPAQPGYHSNPRPYYGNTYRR
jgi:hypothetical protein